MDDSTSNSVSFPVNSQDKRPLPEIIADLYGFKLAFVDHTDGNRYYAVQDWIIGVAQTTQARSYWVKLQKRLAKANVQLLPAIHQLPYRATSGRVYQMDHVQAETLYQIIQRMDAQSGLRDNILKYLAAAGVKLDQLRIEPEQILEDAGLDADKALEAIIRSYQRQGKAPHWISTRLQSTVQRVKFTDAFRAALRTQPSQYQYAAITDELRLGLWKRSTVALRLEMGLKDNANLRDNQSALALTYEMLAEQISMRELELKRDIEYEQSRQIVRTNSASVGKHAEETGRRLGIDIATDKPLLKATN